MRNFGFFNFFRHTLEILLKNGYRPVFGHWRHMYLGDEVEAGDPNHFMSFTDLHDAEELVNYIHKKHPKADLYLAGMSMGGNVWLRWASASKSKVN